jgi:LPS O-antigen subunit length determinant protein (WzzB/FepE family)
MGSAELQRFIDNKSLVALKKFAKAEAELKGLKAKHDAVLEQIQEAMEANGVQKIEGDWGYITLAERTSYKDDGASEGVMDEIQHFLATHEDTETLELSKKLQYLKLALDTEKVKAEAVLTGKLPEGVAESKTKYLTKKFKEL